MPWAVRASVSGPMGRWGSRPSIWNRARRPRAPQTGSRNRRVEPLSPQGRLQISAGAAMGAMCRVSPFRVISAPMARRQPIVASISFEVPLQTSSHGASDNAAQSSSRWAWDLEGMAAAVPRRGAGVRVTVMA